MKLRSILALTLCIVTTNFAGGSCSSLADTSPKVTLPSATILTARLNNNVLTAQLPTTTTQKLVTMFAGKTFSTNQLEKKIDSFINKHRGPAVASELLPEGSKFVSDVMIKGFELSVYATLLQDYPNERQPILDKKLQELEALKPTTTKN